MYESFLFNGPFSLLFLILLLSVTTIPIYHETQQYYVTDFSRKYHKISVKKKKSSQQRVLEKLDSHMEK